MINEDAVEQQAIAWFQDLGWAYLHGSKLAPDVAPEQRADGKAVVLEGRLKAPIARLNPQLPAEAVEEVARVAVQREHPENWGRGTLKMAELTARAGLPRPEIEADAVSVTVRFRPSVYMAPERVGADLTREQQAVLTLLGRADRLARRQLLLDLREAGFDVPERSLREHLNHLRRLGLAAHNGGSGRGSFWSLVHPDQAPRPEAGFDALPEG